MKHLDFCCRTQRLYELENIHFTFENAGEKHPIQVYMFIWMRIWKVWKYNNIKYIQTISDMYMITRKSGNEQKISKQYLNSSNSNSWFCLFASEGCARRTLNASTLSTRQRWGRKSTEKLGKHLDSLHQQLVKFLFLAEEHLMFWSSFSFVFE